MPTKKTNLRYGCAKWLCTCFSSSRLDGYQLRVRFLGDPLSVPARKYFTMGFFAGYPVSTGHVHIKDGQNPDAAIDFEGAYVKWSVVLIPKTCFKYSRILLLS